MKLRDSGYWLFLPKPWRGRKIVKEIDRETSVNKSRRLQNIFDVKFHKKNRRISKIDYTRGQPLFVLPKVLSRGIHLWPKYESRLQRWLKDKKLHKPSTSFASERGESRGSNSSLRRDSLDQSSFYEEDPIRGFYTIWNFNSVKVPKNKLESTEKIYAYIESISKSERVERQLSKPPRGGVSGLIEDPSCLSAKGRDTLQRWSRLASHYEAGQESGEDEDPIEMWNRAVETSMLRNNSSCLSSASAALSQTTHSDIQSPKDDSNSKKDVRTVATASTAEISKERKAAIESAAATSDSPQQKGSLAARKDIEKKGTPLLSKQKQGCENRPTPYRPEAADEVAELRRKSGRIFALKSTENTPERRGKETRTPDSQKPSTPYSLRKRTLDTSEASLSRSASKTPSSKKKKKVVSDDNTLKNVKSVSSTKTSNQRKASSVPQTPTSNCHVF